LITTESHLLRIPPSDLPRLHLPLLLEVELRRYILLALRNVNPVSSTSPNRALSPERDRFGHSFSPNRRDDVLLEVPPPPHKRHSTDADLLEHLEARDRSMSSSSSGSDVTGVKEVLTAESLTEMLLPRSVMFNLTRKERETIREQWKSIQSSSDLLQIFYSYVYLSALLLNIFIEICLWQRFL